MDARSGAGSGDGERVTRIGNTHKKDGRASFELRIAGDGATLICTTGHLQQTATQVVAETSQERPSEDVELIEETEGDWIVQPGMEIEVMAPSARRTRWCI